MVVSATNLSAETLMMPNRDARMNVPVVVWGVTTQANGTAYTIGVSAINAFGPGPVASLSQHWDFTTSAPFTPPVAGTYRFEAIGGGGGGGEVVVRLLGDGGCPAVGAGGRSGGPPAGDGTTSLIGLSGKACAAHTVKKNTISASQLAVKFCFIIFLRMSIGLPKMRNRHQSHQANAIDGRRSRPGRQAYAFQYPP